MPTKRESIKKFLDVKALPDLAALYHPGMEVQVNVAQDGGELVTGEYNGHQWRGWTDGSQTWKMIRIPFASMSEPHYEDSPMKWDLAVHAEGIGMTGFDFQNHRSVYVAYDFDAITGHSEKHTKKLTEQELSAVQKLACEIPWVTVRQSTSGNGLHLYVFLEGVTGIKNHTEHAAVARAILGKMGAITGFDFNAKVDNCGSNIWVWHRKFDKAAGAGLKLIKKGVPLHDIPINWRDHVRVTSGAKRKSKPGFVEETEVDWFDEMCGQHPKVPLDDAHRALIDFLEAASALWWFDPDHHMLVCHTADLAAAHEKLSLKGIFKTNATGKEHGADQNCYCFPQRKGAWAVRRHTRGVLEAETWDQDNGGWTRCYLNKDPDLKTAARTHGGIENEKGAFVFRAAESAAQAAAALGAHVQIDPFINQRGAKLKAHKDGRLIFEINAAAGDNAALMKDWVEEKGVWRRVLNGKVSTQTEPELANYDDVVRHLITSGGEDWGWTIKSDGIWAKEPYQNVKLGLGAFGVTPKDIPIVMGSLIVKRWTLVNKPFQPEYPGDRHWNRNAAQLAFAPSLDVDYSKFPTWRNLLAHVGSGLDLAIAHHSWCQENGIKTGGDYLMLWAASLFQEPLKHLPYLFLFSQEQGTGKTTFADAISLLMTKGVIRADAALINQNGFNGELENIVLCVVEETDLRHNKGTAYNRIKDWVTNDTMLIHEKGKTPYTVVNSTHWIHNANDQEECPIFPGDTRITMCYVKPLLKMIDRESLFHSLTKEAPDFLAAILNLEIARSPDRNNVPVIETEEKKRAQKLNQTELEQFLEESTYPIPGELIKYSDLYERFQEWLDPERVSAWSQVKTGRELVRLGFVKGRREKGIWYIGNISWTNDSKIKKPRWVLNGESLMPEGTE